MIDACDADGKRYGIDALERVLASGHDMPAAHLAQACLDDMEAFEDGAPRADDTTLMVLRRDDAT